MFDIDFAKVSHIRRGAFAELESEEDVKLALSRCMDATICGRVLGMCSSSVSVS